MTTLHIQELVNGQLTYLFPGGEGAGLVPDPMGSKNSKKKPKYFVEKQKGISPVSN